MTTHLKGLPGSLAPATCTSTMYSPTSCGVKPATTSPLFASSVHTGMGRLPGPGGGGSGGGDSGDDGGNDWWWVVVVVV